MGAVSQREDNEATAAVILDTMEASGVSSQEQVLSVTQYMNIPPDLEVKGSPRAMKGKRKTFSSPEADPDLVEPVSPTQRHIKARLVECPISTASIEHTEFMEISEHSTQASEKETEEIDQEGESRPQSSSPSREKENIITCNSRKKDSYKSSDKSSFKFDKLIKIREEKRNKNVKKDNLLNVMKTSIIDSDSEREDYIPISHSTSSNIVNPSNSDSSVLKKDRDNSPKFKKPLSLDESEVVISLSEESDTSVFTDKSRTSGKSKGKKIIKITKRGRDSDSTLEEDELVVLW